MAKNFEVMVLWVVTPCRDVVGCYTTTLHHKSEDHDLI